MHSRRSVLFATVAAISALAAPAFAAETKTFDPESFAAAQQAGKPILVAIHASWCPTCKAQKPILSELMRTVRPVSVVVAAISCTIVR